MVSNGDFCTTESTKLMSHKVLNHEKNTYDILNKSTQPKTPLKSEATVLGLGRKLYCTIHYIGSIQLIMVTYQNVLTIADI